MIEYNPIPIIFRLGQIEVHSIGFAFTLAFLLGFLLALKEVRRRELNPDDFKKMFFLIILGAIIGGRLFFVFENVKYFFDYPVEIFKVWKGGASSYGGFIGGFLLPFIYFKKNKLNFLSYADAVVPALCMGIFIKRIGCFLNWCCYGSASSLPWAINAGDFPRHPTQIYLALNGLILFFLFSKLKHKQKYSGWLLSWCLIVYGASRFLIEFLRDSERYLFNLTIAQWASGILFALACFFIMNKEKQTD
ncbi:MAG: prolipoprotein diacylglyceryl transferase [Candidatus Aminicenantes bacterium]|nr:prolipoprotein diacylglyceryl transferase [Candidatus Aminicenantes bacterium]